VVIVILVDYHIYRYRLPFVRPLAVQNMPLHAREGLLVRLQTGNGIEAFGDVPPLPGLSEESIEIAYIQLDEICRQFIGQDIAWGSSAMQDSLNPRRTYPSVRFGVESALLDLIAQEKNVTPAHILSRSPHFQIKTNGLVAASLADIPGQAQKSVDTGFTHLKIKVGRDDLAKEAKMLQKVQAIVGEEIKFRLDANRAWNMTQAVQFARTVRELNIDYIEEPLNDPEMIGHFYQKAGIRFALDESLREQWIVSPPQGTAAFILKPGIHGSLSDLSQIAQNAHKHGITPVISSAFLNVVGLKMAAMLAAATTSANDVMGLDTSSWLAVDFVSEPIKIKNGSLNAHNLHTNFELHPEYIQEIN
jgi:O-succinylbenzoate synthase